MKFYWFPPAPNAARVAFYIREKGLEIEHVLVDFTKGEQRSPEHLARNPSGTVPVLELDDGTFVTESVAIVEYLEELHPEPPMIGSEPRTRALTRARERFIDLNVLLRVIRIVHATNSPLGLPPDPAVATSEGKRLPVGLARVDHWLSDGEFVCGAAPTIADCTLLAAINFARFGQLELDPGLANLHRWFDAYALRHL